MCATNAGPLPASWATPGAFPSLTTLIMSANNLSGPLPPEWGANGTTFVKLRKLDLRQNGFSGYLPDAWGSGFRVILSRLLLLNLSGHHQSVLGCFLGASWGYLVDYLPRPQLKVWRSCICSDGCKHAEGSMMSRSGGEGCLCSLLGCQRHSWKDV